MAQGADPPRLALGQGLRSQTRCRAEPHDARDVERPRSEAAFLAAAFHLWLQTQGRPTTLAYEKCAHALGPVHFVRRKAHQVDAPVLDGHGRPAHPPTRLPLEDCAVL